MLNYFTSRPVCGHTCIVVALYLSAALPLALPPINSGSVDQGLIQMIFFSFFKIEEDFVNFGQNAIRTLELWKRD